MWPEAAYTNRWAAPRPERRIPARAERMRHDMPNRRRTCQAYIRGASWKSPGALLARARGLAGTAEIGNIILVDESGPGVNKHRYRRLGVL